MTDLHEKAQRLAAEGHTVTLEIVTKEGVAGITEVLHHYPISCIQCQSAREQPNGKAKKV